MKNLRFEAIVIAIGLLLLCNSNRIAFTWRVHRTRNQ